MNEFWNNELQPGYYDHVLERSLKNNAGSARYMMKVLSHPIAAFSCRINWATTNPSKINPKNGRTKFATLLIYCNALFGLG